MAYIETGRCKLISRRGNTFKMFGDLCKAISEAVPGIAVLDGEGTCLDPEGRPQFRELFRRKLPQTFCAFDLLWVNGRDLRGLPLLDRKQMLQRLVRSPILYVDHIAERGVELFKAACKRDLEGIVAKLANGRYDPAATTWVKIKNREYSQAEGRGDSFLGSVLKWSSNLSLEVRYGFCFRHDFCI